MRKGYGMPAQWERVSRDQPCPVCGHADWCAYVGALVYCMRIESGKPVASGGWIHKLTGKALPSGKAIPKAPKKRVSDDEAHANWAPYVRALQRGADVAVERLARQLGVASWALNALGVGYGELQGRMCWSFPERNAKGQVVGINRRLVVAINGDNKRSVDGGKRGLSYCTDWSDCDGPVHIVEGGSDTAAGITLGLSVIGRPSNVGGVHYLLSMLRKIDPNRRIVVLAERDKKQHGDLKPLTQRQHRPNCRGCMACWPGLIGAKQTALALRMRLNRRVEWRLLPDGTKDLRDWLNRQHINVNSPAVAFAAGRVISSE